MKYKILLLIGTTLLVSSVQAQKNKKSKLSNSSGYAITAIEKGGRSWKEVRLVDLASGEVLKTVYDSKQEIQPLNARTGKPVAATDKATVQAKTPVATFVEKPARKVVNLDEELSPGQRVEKRVIYIRQSAPISLTEPFATNSAACALDKKNERLYYTPMGISQLRFIDLQSGKIYFFENESFGKVSGMHDVANQITRMVIASDGNGYALSNDAKSLVRFTTGKKTTITDLGTLTDDPANTRSVHHGGNFGGDMVADARGNLYLVTANRNVYQISIETRVATHKGMIKGLPQGFSTNGAMVEEDSKVILASSESTMGYFRFDLNTLQAEKLTAEGKFFNASDLANGNLAFAKKKKDRQDTKPSSPVSKADDTEQARAESTELLTRPGISVYPNPVTEGILRLSFSDQPAGRYRISLIDVSGRTVGTREINVLGAAQVEELRFPELSVKGNYLVRVTSEANKINVTEKVIVQ